MSGTIGTIGGGVGVMVGVGATGVGETTGVVPSTGGTGAAVSIMISPTGASGSTT